MAEKKPVEQQSDEAGWLLLDLADFLRMCQARSATVVDKQQRKTLNIRLARQLRQQEKAGDPFNLVKKVRDLMANAEAKG